MCSFLQYIIWLGFISSKFGFSRSDILRDLTGFIMERDLHNILITQHNNIIIL